MTLYRIFVLAIGFSFLAGVCPAQAQPESTRTELKSSADADSAWAPSSAAQAASQLITEPLIRSHIRYLADDLLEGRGPGSRGDALTQRYIATQLEGLGIQPAAPGGQWLQPVPLLGVTTSAPTSIEFRSDSASLVLNHFDDMMAVSGRPESDVSIEDAQLLFVGYGIQAPEYDWDDYKGVDVAGKVLVMMNNDPEDDPNLFAGSRRLYYGRWDYKYAMAAKLGAAGALIIHTTASAGYPYQVVRTSWAGEEFELASREGPRTSLKGWLTEQSARKVVQLAGKDLDQLREAAQSRDFQPVPLAVELSVALKCKARKQTTANVLGVLPGNDPQLKKEHVIFMAHHDHLGVGKERGATEDNIYNGAIDNASGTASLLAIARAIASRKGANKRSILFAFVGAEEQGLLGSEHFAQHPVIPAGYISAVINIDGMNFLGKTHDINLIGNGKSDLDSTLHAVAAWQNRVVVPDYQPDRGYYYRSDQFSLAKIGVPGVYLHSGINVIGKPAGWGKHQLDQWVKNIYHQPSDEFDPKWNLAGGVEDAQLLMHVGLEIANQPKQPAWLPGDEFEAARLAALQARDQ